MSKRILGILLVIVGLGACAPEAEDEAEEAPMDLGEFLAGEDEGERYARITGPEPLSFPADHGPHPEYRHEWWYVTGNLETPEGRHFGFQVTFFRFNLDPEAPERDGAWATRQSWMAHLALTDTEGERFHHAERFGRGAAGIAGARAEPFAVWLEDWSLESVGEATWPARLRGEADDFAIDLEINPERRRTLQGEAGYSRKGPGEGNASRYYSYTRMVAEGAVRSGEEQFPVRGRAWMDREWGSSALAEDQQGWDWFALQLDDGSDLMLYRIRASDGGMDPHSKGVLVHEDGRRVFLDADQVDLEVLDTWESPEGRRYPVAWDLRIPEQDLALEVQPRMRAQEITGAFNYWEGAVHGRGHHGDTEVSFQGYLELSGYDGDR